MSDKSIEQSRYESSAISLINSSDYDPLNRPSGIVLAPVYLRKPYLKYHEIIVDAFEPSLNVLELTSGIGDFI